MKKKEAERGRRKTGGHSTKSQNMCQAQTTGLVALQLIDLVLITAPSPSGSGGDALTRVERVSR
ncbi:MAG TPA: hypothetical protein ENJ20_01870 [Bacteroidetes bacterium]|nr:hypothetical protein [Bacteroidota bacterium]